jgi:hypothetical protein
MTVVAIVNIRNSFEATGQGLPHLGFPLEALPEELRPLGKSKEQSSEK